MPYQDCAGGCGELVRGGHQVACRACWSRLPRELAVRYETVRRGFSTTGGNAGDTRTNVMTAVREWWAANPPAPREKREPLWKRHRPT